jgi:SAM-dependent methyltransferase
VRARLRFEEADLLALAPRHARAFDVVCSHGVLMYLPSLHDAVAALAGAARPGALLSVLTRNRASIAMRAGMLADWEGAMRSFDADRYTNRIGVDDVRGDDPADVRGALGAAGARTIAWYGVRLFSDHWSDVAPPDDVAMLFDAEEQAGRRDPYRGVAALTHTIARAG